MRARTRITAALAAAALVAIGGTALTAAVTFPGGAEVLAGYGQVTVNGVTIENVKYEVLSGDTHFLDQIVLTTTAAQDVGDAAGYDSQLTMNGPTGTPIDCTAVYAGGTTKTTITCDVPDTTAIATLTSIELSVVHLGP